MSKYDADIDLLADTIAKDLKKFVSKVIDKRMKLWAEETKRITTELENVQEIPERQRST